MLSGGHPRFAVRPRRVRRGRRRASRRLFERFERERVRFHPRRHRSAATRAAALRPFRPPGGRGARLGSQTQGPRGAFRRREDARLRDGGDSTGAAEAGDAAPAFAVRRVSSSTTRTSFCATRSMPRAEEVAVAERPRNVSGARTDASGPVRERVLPHRTRCPTRRAFTGASAVTLTCDRAGTHRRAWNRSATCRSKFLPLRPSNPRRSSSGGSSRVASRLKPSSGGARAPAVAGRARRWRGGCSARRARCSCTSSASAPKTRRARRAATRLFCRQSRGDSQRGYPANAFAPRLDEGRATDHASGRDGHARAVLGRGGSRAPDGVGGAGGGGQSIRQPGAVPDLSADEAAAATRTYAADESAAGEAARAQLASYRLAGVVSHLGASIRRGHYVASAWRAEKTKTVLRRRRSDGCLSTTSARAARGHRRRPRPRLATGTSPRSSAKPRGDANGDESDSTTRRR